jgi:hypothetical protein
MLTLQSSMAKDFAGALPLLSNGFGIRRLRDWYAQGMSTLRGSAGPSNAWSAARNVTVVGRRIAPCHQAAGTLCANRVIRRRPHAAEGWRPVFRQPSSILNFE